MCQGVSCWYCYKDGEGGWFRACFVDGGIPFAGEGRPHCALLLEDAMGVSHLSQGYRAEVQPHALGVSEDFHGPQGCGGVDGGQGMFARKWQLHCEGVDWLGSFLPTKPGPLTSKNGGPARPNHHQGLCSSSAHTNRAE